MPDNRYIDPAEIRQAIQILKPGGQLFEVRIIRGFSSISGYFRDADSLIGQLEIMNLKDANVYMTLQEIHPGCEARRQWGEFIDSGRAKIPTTSDDDIVRYRYIPIDLDPVRPAGISSSEEELNWANELRCQIAAFMEAQGFKKSIQAFSGNGYHLLYTINEPNNDGTQKYVCDVLGQLNKLFSNASCHVDTTNSNPSRVFKLYGTLAQKGRNTKERPHRMSRILEVKGFETY